jgi:Predicted membrane protein
LKKIKFGNKDELLFILWYDVDAKRFRGGLMLILKKVVKVILAFLCNGMAISLFILAGFGLDSISVFSAGLANVFHTTVGMASLGFYFVVILATFLYDRRYISGATLLSLVIVGPSIDLFTKIFSHVVTPESDLAVRIVFFVIAYLSLAFAVALYLSVHFGISGADMIPVIVSDKAKKEFRWCKVAFDITVIIIGILLGGSFGIGTIIVGFITGPTIQYFRRNLEKRNGE